EVTRNSAVLVVLGKQLANVSLVVLAGNVGTVKTTLLNDTLRVVLHGANNVALSRGTTEGRVNVVDVLRLNVNGGTTKGALAGALSGTLGNSLAPLFDGLNLGNEGGPTRLKLGVLRPRLSGESSVTSFGVNFGATSVNLGDLGAQLV